MGTTEDTLKQLKRDSDQGVMIKGSEYLKFTEMRVKKPASVFPNVADQGVRVLEIHRDACEETGQRISERC